MTPTSADSSPSTSSSTSSSPETTSAPTLREHTILVTGGARRVGGAISRELALRGARLVVHTRRVDPEVERFVGELPGAAAWVSGDLSSSAVPSELLADAAGRGFAVTGVVHAAASFVHAPPLALDGAAWNEVFDLNLRAFYLLARALEAQRGKRGGSLVAIADSGALELWPGYLAHCVSKAALIRLCEALAKAMAPRYQVNAVVPGPVLPPEEASVEERELIAARTLVGHLGRPEDVARAVAFLLETPFCTGTILEVTGGAHLWRPGSPKA